MFEWGHNVRNDEKEFSWRESAIIFSDKRSNGRSADFFIAEATVIGLDNEADYYKDHCSNVPFTEPFGAERSFVPFKNIFSNIFCRFIKLIWSGPIVRNYDMKKLTKKLIIVKSKE